MKHSRSSAEWEIREAVVAWLRVEFPHARIIHELVVGGCRADIAAVTRDRVLMFEIKSEKDKLDRLGPQMRAFHSSAHHAVLVAHRKWFDTTPYNNGRPRLAWTHATDGFDSFLSDVWCYPDPADSTMHSWRRTNAMLASMRQPHAIRLLGLLWKAEALDLGRRYQAPVGARLNQSAINDVIAWRLTGQQICEGVCAALRARPFAEADEPIAEVAA